MSRKVQVQAQTKISDVFPLLALDDDLTTIITKEGDLVRTIKIEGLDYSGLTDDQINYLDSLRKQFFEIGGSQIGLAVHSHRSKVTESAIEHLYTHPLAQQVADKWSEGFQTIYKTTHYIVVSTKRPQLIDKAGKALGQAIATKPKEEALADAISDIKVKLNDFTLTELTGNELTSYWGSLINGNASNIKARAGLFDDYLFGQELFFPEGKAYSVYGNGDEAVYSSWLSVKAYPDVTDNNLFDLLFKIEEDFSVYQSFTQLSKAQAVSYIEEKKKEVFAFTKSGGIQEEELGTILDRVEADEVSLVTHTWVVEVKAPSESALKLSVSKIKQAIESKGLMTYSETINSEALFWSRFPSYEHLNVRGRKVTAYNASHMANFQKVGQGFTSCSFGDAAVCEFKTVTGAPYGFTFHNEPGPMALGHTLIFGGSNFGKTTLISFLVTMCHKYPDFKALMLDSLRGLEVLTTMLDGEYQDYSANTHLNPFQLDDTPANRSFIHSWLVDLTGKEDDGSAEQIKTIIDSAYSLDPEHRSLAELELAFGQKGEGTFHEAMEKWMPGGSFGQYFSSNKDSLSFDKQIVTFDSTSILEQPHVLGVATQYIFHRLKETVLEHPSPYVVFVDEMVKYLNSPQFAPKIQELVREIRKTNGVFIGAMQEVGPFIENPHSKPLLESTATLLLAPSATAEAKYYIDGLGLNEAEFDWIRTPSNRQMLMKRKGGESTVLDINLAPLGDYLNMFDSSSKAVKRLRDEKALGGDWKERFLQG